MDGTGPQRPLGESQLDRDIESVLSIEPSPEFLARVRTRVACEPEMALWRLAIRRWSFEPLVGMAVIGVVLTIVVPQLLRPTLPDTQVAELNHRAEILPFASDATTGDVRRTPHPQVQNARRSRARLAGAASASRGSRSPAFEERVLIAPYEREAFARLLTVVNDHTIELIAPVLESTRTGGDISDAAVTVPVLAASEGVGQ